jgi:invasion protein IalB
VFEVELQMAGDGKLEGTILMPFGLKLDSGVVLRTAATISESDLPVEAAATV